MPDQASIPWRDIFLLACASLVGFIGWTIKEMLRIRDEKIATIQDQLLALTIKLEHLSAHVEPWDGNERRTAP